MAPAPIEVLRVRGSHREAGRQVGRACRERIRAAAAEAGTRLPGGRTLDEQLALAEQYRRAASAGLPWAVEELDGMAEGAGIDPLLLFALDIEEIWPPEESGGRCSDLVAIAPATADGHVLVGHNNDLSPEREREIVAVEWDVPGEPLTLTIGSPPSLSVGFNAAGLSLTGNELTPNDERIGIPRQLQFRAMLKETGLEGAVGVSLQHDRASSYNNIVADGSRVVNVEGSATDAELIEPSANGVLAHTNHYACDSMLGREGDHEYAARSAVRLRRAFDLLEATAPGSITASMLRTMLSDHANEPDSICRHAEPGGDSKTVFWCIADVTAMHLRFGRGNPCDSQEQEYRFSANLSAGLTQS